MCIDYTRPPCWWEGMACSETSVPYEEKDIQSQAALVPGSILPCLLEERPQKRGDRPVDETGAGSYKIKTEVKNKMI